MSTNSTLTAEEIVLAAMQELGVLAAGEKPSAADTVDAIRSLNWMLKGWQARGLNLWRQATRIVIFPAGVQSIALDQDIEDIASIRTGTPTERPLFRYERGQYVDLPNKASVGQPTVFYPDRGVDHVTLYLWPVPIAAVSLSLDIIRRMGDVTDPSQVIDVPQEWLEAVYCALASRISNMMGATRTDPNTVTLVIQRAQALERQLFDADRPSSMFLGAGNGGYR